MSGSVGLPTAVTSPYLQVPQLCGALLRQSLWGGVGADQGAREAHGGEAGLRVDRLVVAFDVAKRLVGPPRSAAPSRRTRKRGPTGAESLP